MAPRFVILVLAALIAAAGGGWLLGTAERSALEQQLAGQALRVEFADTRALVLEGRVNLYQSNFGTAIERFQQARNLIGSMQERLRGMGQPAQAGRFDVVISHLSDAMRLAAAFDGRAQTAAEQALTALMTGGGA